MNQYPNYTKAIGILPSEQIPMEALWLHLNTSHTGSVVIPKSFDASAYWTFMVENNTDYIAYRKITDTRTCNTPPDKSNDATIERAIQQQGLDIYDSAIWQIALAVALKNDRTTYLQDIEDYKNFLMNGLESGFQSYYAYKDYTYNGKSVTSPKNAYLLKFVSPTWAGNHDSINDCNMQWPEWEAVTGEEAWAVLIGPVQAIYQINNGTTNPEWSSTSQAGDYIQLGKNALNTIKQMQTANGGVYRNVTLPGQPQSYNISLENNFSLYAGLNMLQSALKARITVYQNKIKAHNTQNTKEINNLQKVMHSDQEDIQTIIEIKQGMVKYFTGQGGVTVFNRDGNYFYSATDGTTAATDFAVDVQTWGATVIATSKKDPTEPGDPDLLQAITDTYGDDAMYKMLQAAITQGGYRDQNNKLLGVGYTAQQPTDSFYELSGEWTLGAINAAIVLADHYKNDSSKYSTLIAEAKDMMEGVTQETSSLQGNGKKDSGSRISYLYANKRTFIPFGWFSNKMPAMASTGWSLMVNSCFNPMELGGGNYQSICQQLTR